MCLTPVLIKNPTYTGGKYLPWQKNLHKFADTTSTHIYVPCGHCAQCLAKKQSDFIQRAQMEAVDNEIFMFTLTYKNQFLPYLRVNGFDLSYPDITHVQNMFKRLRKDEKLPKGFKYVVVSEYGGKYHRPHYHGMLFIPKGIFVTKYDITRYEKYLYDLFLEYWSVNVNAIRGRRGKGTRNPCYLKLLDLHINPRNGRRTYDLHWVNPHIGNDNDVAFYVTKYLMKYDSFVKRRQQALRLNLEPSEYKRIWTLVRPKMLVSKHFGETDYARDYVRMCSNKTMFSHPWFSFINPTDGRTFPMSNYFMRKFVPLEDKILKYDIYESDLYVYGCKSTDTELKLQEEIDRKTFKHNCRCKMIEDTCYIGDLFG